MTSPAFASHPFGAWVNSAVGGWIHGYYLPQPLPRHLVLTDEGRESAERAQWELAKLSGLSETVSDLEVLMRPAALHEALASSRIEGTQATLRDVVTSREGETFSDDVDEVLALFRAMTEGRQMLESLPIAGRFIAECHRILLDSKRGSTKKPGAFRAEPVWIGSPGDGPKDARFIPPHPSRIPDLMADWESFVNTPPQMPLVVRLALAHYQFETIHPFEDGNGRLGRLLIGMQVVQEGVLPWPVVTLSRALHANRRSYYDGLQLVHETGNMEAWVRFFADSLAEEVRHSYRSVVALSQLRNQMVSDASANQASLRRLVDVLFRHPVLRVADVVDGAQVSQPTASRILQRAESLGWIESLGQSGRGRKETWWAPRIWSAHTNEDPRIN